MSAGQETDQAIQAHYAQFYLKLNSNFANKDHTAYPMPEGNVLTKITDFMLRIKGGSTVGKLKNDHPHRYMYINTFDVVNLVVGEHPILIYRQKPDESGTLPPVTQCVRVSCCSTCFFDIRAVQIASSTHMKGQKILDAVKEKMG